jgi:hypothetical protein
MPGHGSKLARKQEQAVAALLANPTVEAAAGECGVSTRALKGWLQQPDFKAAYAAARRRLLESAVNGLVRAGQAAVAALTRSLKSDKEPVAIRAAQIILENATRGVEAFDLHERLEALERLAARERPAAPAGRGDEGEGGDDV